LTGKTKAKTKYFRPFLTRQKFSENPIFEPP
jgi:hypothetical protein